MPVNKKSTMPAAEPHTGVRLPRWLTWSTIGGIAAIAATWQIVWPAVRAWNAEYMRVSDAKALIATAQVELRTEFAVRALAIEARFAEIEAGRKKDAIAKAWDRHSILFIQATLARNRDSDCELRRKRSPAMDASEHVMCATYRDEYTAANARVIKAFEAAQSLSR